MRRPALGVPVAASAKKGKTRLGEPGLSTWSHDEWGIRLGVALVEADVGGTFRIDL